MRGQLGSFVFFLAVPPLAAVVSVHARDKEAARKMKERDLGFCCRGLPLPSSVAFVIVRLHRHSRYRPSLDFWLGGIFSFCFCPQFLVPLRKGEMVVPAKITVRRRERKEGVDRRGFVVVVAAVALGEMPNPNMLFGFSFVDRINGLEGV